MPREHGQATVEYVGTLLLVAALVAGILLLAGAPGPVASIGRAVVRTFANALGTTPLQVPVASAADRELFGRATDVRTPVDDRPSLADVRRELIARDGAERGTAAFDALLLAQVRTAIPALAGPVRLGSLDIRDWMLGDGLQRMRALRVAMTPPEPGDSGQLETPIGTPSLHVVSISEEDAGFRKARHPSASPLDLGLDLAAAAPGLGVVLRAGKLVAAGAQLASDAANVFGLYEDTREAVGSLAPSADEIPAGQRAGDVVVRWTATRRAPDGTPAPVEHTAVLRDGHVLAVALTLAA